MNPQNILEQFLGPDASSRAGNAMQDAKSNLANSGMGGVAGGLAAGGLLGVLLSNKKARKSVGKLAGYGGAAALGALAFRAYQNWQTNQPPGGAAAGNDRGGANNQGGHFPTDRVSAHTVHHQPPGDATFPSDPRSGDQVPIEPPPPTSRFNPAAAPASDGNPFELAIVMAMIGAANADGHIGPDEQRTIFDRVGEMPLDSEDKAFVFDTLSKPPSLQDIAALADGPEQAAELYLASRLAIDPDHPAEQAYLEALASRLSLPAELVSHLNDQAAAAMA